MITIIAITFVVTVIRVEYFANFVLPFHISNHLQPFNFNLICWAKLEDEKWLLTMKQLQLTFMLNSNK